MSEDPLNRFTERLKIDEKELEAQLAQVKNQFPLIGFHYAMLKAFTTMAYFPALPSFDTEWAIHTETMVKYSNALKDLNARLRQVNSYEDGTSAFDAFDEAIRGRRQPQPIKYPETNKTYYRYEVIDGKCPECDQTLPHSS